MRVQTGCPECKRCNNSGVAELGRRQAKFWGNLALLFIPLMIQAFTPTCRACGHKRSLHKS